MEEIEKALEGSPFSVNRDRLEYFSLISLHLGKMENPEKHVRGIVALDGKKMHTRICENEDGTIRVTFRDTLRNAAVPVSVSRERSLFTHQGVTKYLSENKIKLIAISWGHDSLSFSKDWRGEPFGARMVSAE